MCFPGIQIYLIALPSNYVTFSSCENAVYIKYDLKEV